MLKLPEKNLNGALPALEELRALRVRDHCASQARDTLLVALLGLYHNAALQEGQIPNRTLPEFKTDEACVKTALENLQELAQKTNRQNIELTPIHTDLGPDQFSYGNRQEAYEGT